MKIARLYHDGSLAIQGELIEKTKEELLLYFNGTSQAVTIANTNNRLQPTIQTTWECWFKIDLANHTQYDSIMGFANNSWDIRMDGATSFTCHWYDLNSNWGAAIQLTSPYSLWDEEWHHIALVRDGINGVKRAYIDGVLRMNSTMPLGDARDMSGSASFSIGSVNNGTSRTMCGNIKEVRIWDTARTTEEVVDNMNIKLTGNETGLKFYLPLNEGKGETIIDKASGFEVNVNGAVWKGIAKNITLNNNGDVEIFGEFVEGDKFSVGENTLGVTEIIEGGV